MNAATSSLMKFLSVAAVFSAGLAPANHASAAQKSASWSDEACVHRISFDPAKYDEKRLKNTINLLFEPSKFEAPVPPFVGESKDIAGLDPGKYDQQCGAALKTVRGFELLPLNGIEDYQRAKTEETEDFCRFGNIQIRGYRDPSALREYARALNFSRLGDADALWDEGPRFASPLEVAEEMREVIARHPRCWDRDEVVFDPIHYLPLLEQKINALDQAAPLQGWDLPEVFTTLRRLMETRMGKHGRREYVQVLRLLETFTLADLQAAVEQAIDLGAIGFDAVKHLVLCRIERVPPRLDLDVYPFLPRTTVEKTFARAYLSLLSDRQEAA